MTEAEVAEIKARNVAALEGKGLSSPYDVQFLLSEIDRLRNEIAVLTTIAPKELSKNSGTGCSAMETQYENS